MCPPPFKKSDVFLWSPVSEIVKPDWQAHVVLKECFRKLAWRDLVHEKLVPTNTAGEVEDSSDCFGSG